ncbi:hypothetical protein CK911_16850 [Aeromonas sp. CU5]|uniref:hypothetical protein n=1 Tax=Aeromonas sp. CU5 TaxID=2033033 RepID=UPI000BFCE8D7|nr:hypothetical protein [Aeromonas sp. CU5]ATL94289.1 hypothetical protein CK911_16850 [Aeromonas sp. CU5]
MKPTNKSLLSMPERQIPQMPSDEPETVPPAEPAREAPCEPPIAPVLAELPLPSFQSGTTSLSAPPIVVVPVTQPLPARASNKLVGALICTSLALVASLVFIARLHLAALPLVVNEPQPLAEFGVAAMDQPDPLYAMELAFPQRETTIPLPVAAPGQKPAKLKIGVYKQADNVEKWRRWARQQNVTFEAVKKNRDGEPHYVLYLCEQDPSRIDQLKLDVARISGETPLLVRRASSASI